MPKMVQRSTPYRKAREAIGMKQFRAVMEIPSSKTSIHRYETGEVVPPVDVVKRMDEVYRCEGRLIQYYLTGKFSFEQKEKAILTAIKIALGKIFSSFKF